MSWQTLLLVTVCAALAASSLSPAYAQFRGEAQVEASLPAEARANLFATWEGRKPADGFYVDLPPGWTLHQATLLGFGYAKVPVAVQPAGPGRYTVLAARPLRGVHELVLHTTTGPEAADAPWRLTPLLRHRRGPESRLESQPALASTRPVRTNAAPATTGNEALFFDGTGPLLLHADALPHLDTDRAFTVAFWMKTTGLGEVILSTWDGDAHRPYPLELVVDARGRLLAYRGRPGEHVSLQSTRPVADGTWHHVAVVQEAGPGRTRLFLDGVAVDSLVASESFPIAAGATLALGGRLPGDERAHPYSGALDELSVRRGALSDDVLRNSLRRPPRSSVVHAQRGVVHLTFDEAVPSSLTAHSARTVTRRPSDLTFFAPLDHLRADAGTDHVQLTWTNRDAATEAFEVERSYDGQQFTSLGRVEAEAGVPSGVDLGLRYAFTDTPDPSAQVLFYRVRQRLAGGSEHVSSLLKLSRRAAATLLGNYPNPFSRLTTVVYETTETLPVRLSVWDLSGQQVALLVDEERGPGRYDVPFDAEGLPAGTYFVRLIIPTGTITRKVVVMK